MVRQGREEKEAYVGEKHVHIIIADMIKIRIET